MVFVMLWYDLYVNAKLRAPEITERDKQRPFYDKRALAQRFCKVGYVMNLNF